MLTIIVGSLKVTVVRFRFTPERGASTSGAKSLANIADRSDNLELKQEKITKRMSFKLKTFG